jgi:hypothetical protein
LELVQNVADLDFALAAGKHPTHTVGGLEKGEQHRTFARSLLRSLRNDPDALLRFLVPASSTSEQIFGRFNR